MKRYILFFLAAVALLLSAQTTEQFNAYINGLPAAGTLGSSDQFYVRQGGTSKQVPFSSIQSGLGGVTSFNSRSGAVVPNSGDYTFSQIGGVATGAQLPFPSASTLGGVESATAPANQWMNGINTSGVPQFAQPGFTNLTGNISIGQINNGLGANSSTVLFGDNSWRTPAGGGNVSTTSNLTNGNCVQATGTTTVGPTSAPCGSGSGTNLGYINIQTYGATGDGTCHALSSVYGSLGAAQAVYPFVSDLTQCIDWAATQQAINVAYASAPVNASATVYCPAGQYEFSNPVFVDQANNSQGSYAAWAVGTTYGNAANVTYNGIPWLSMGSGNVGNPPTSQNFLPAQIQLANNSTSVNQAGYPWSIVSITNASPAVFTIFGGGSQVVNNQPIVLFPQRFANPATGTTPVLPTGLNANQVYYVRDIVGQTFHVAATAGGTAINTSSAGVGTFFASGQVWQVAPVSNSPSFSNRISLVGDEGIPSNGGCQWQTIHNYTSPVVVLGAQNGSLIKNIYVLGDAGAEDGSATYSGARCTGPSSVAGNPVANSPAGPSVLSVGWALMANGGGSRTKFENTGANRMSYGYYIGYGTNGQLADQNTWEKPSVSDTCVGWFFGETQAFINTVYDASTGFGNTTGVVAYSQEGVKIHGGTWSAGITNAAVFAVTGVSSAAGCGYLCVTATVTSPDVYLNSPMCAYSAGSTFNAGAKWLNSWYGAGACGYNTFVMNVPHWGLIGMYVMNYVPATGVITLGIPTAWNGIYQGTCCGSDLTTQIATVTTMYAAEAATSFYGNNQVDNVHIENAGSATTVGCFCTQFFGGAKVARFTDVFMNTEASLTSLMCCNRPADSLTYKAYIQNVIPFFNFTLGDGILDGFSGGFNGVSAPTGNFAGGMDRALIATETSTYVEGRHMIGSNNQNISSGSAGNNATALFDFANSSIGTAWLNTPPLVNPGTLGQLSGGYYAMGGSAYGSGTWDNPSNFVPSSAYSVNGSNQPVDLASLWRSRGWGQSPFWGVRPAPWASPCILPGQSTNLVTPPTITYTANLQDFLHVNSGGNTYAVNDTITLSGGTGTAAVVFVTGVSGGVITSVQVQSKGSYTGTLPTTFGQASTSGSGTGATFNLPIWYTNYTIPYPLLWGGTIYHACDVKGIATGPFTGTKYAIGSSNTGYSYFQNLTTTNVPGLSWTMDGASPFIYMNLPALELMFPGLVFSLTGSGGCSGTQTFTVLETHPTAGYVKVVRSDTDGSGYVPSLAASGTACSGTTIGQASPNLIFPY